MDLIRSLNIFTRVVDAGSFSAVAREAGGNHSAVTRQIAQLEEHFGVRLFHRSTRRLTLTEDGRDLLAYARQLLDLTETMESGLGQQRHSPQGPVRLGTTVAGGMFIVPRVPKLLRRYPGLSLDLMMRDHIGDLIEERLDLALLAGPITDLSLIARAVGPSRLITVAAPAYLEQRGTPRTPADLAQHDCIVHSERHSAGWTFAGPGGSSEIRVFGKLAVNNTTGVHSAVLSGQGIGVLPEFMAVDDLAAGRLRQVLADYQAPGKTTYVVYPSRRHLAARTRVVIDFLVEEVSELNRLNGAAGEDGQKTPAPV